MLNSILYTVSAGSGEPAFAELNIPDPATDVAESAIAKWTVATPLPEVPGVPFPAQVLGDLQ